MSLSEIDYAPKMPPAMAQSRRTITWNSDAVGPFTSGQVIRISLSGADYLDPQALWVRFTVNFAAPGAVQGTGGAGARIGGYTAPSGAESYYSRGRLLVGSKQLVDINPWNLWNSWLDLTENQSVVESSSSILRGVDLDGTTRTAANCVQSRHIPFTATAGVLGGDYSGRTFLVPLSGFGLLAEKKMVPLRYLSAATPLVIELTVEQFANCVAYDAPVGTDGTTAAPTSRSFSISDVRLVADALDMPSASNEFDAMLASGQRIAYPFMDVRAYPFSISAGSTSFSFPVTHVSEDIVGVVVLFQGADRNADLSGTGNDTGSGSNKIICDELLYPGGHNRNAPATNLIGLQSAYLQIGTRRWPDTQDMVFNPAMPTPDAQQCFVELLKIIGKLSSSDSAPALTPAMWADNYLSLGVNVNANSKRRMGFSLCFSLDSDLSDPDLAGTGATTQTPAVQTITVNGRFSAPIPAYAAGDNRYGGALSAQVYVIDRRTLWIARQGQVEVSTEIEM